jgi:hypothetical protein
MSRRRKKATGSPLLDLLAESLARDDSQDRTDDAAALRAYGELALHQVPLRGIFPPQDEALDDAIDDVATRFLGFGDASKGFEAVTARLTARQRLDVEQAVTQLRIVSDRAYFYAGIAFGVTLVDFGHAREACV